MPTAGASHRLRASAPAAAAAAALLVSSASAAGAGAGAGARPGFGGYMKKSEIPDTGREWMSVSPGGVEFQPAEGVDLRSEMVGRALQEYGNYEEGNNKKSSPYNMQFVDGTETYYNDYAQAWRLIGFYIDCNAPFFNGNQCNGDGGGDWEEDEDGSYQVPCQRYLMWAAYVDLDYVGGGIGEYQFYDRHNDKWDSSSCIANNGRCAKMDCHLKSTNFKLLGFFKEPNYHEWMEQLFKHEGVCIWTDEEYYYMQVDRILWPCQCTNTYVKDEEGNALYYDTKPMPEGRIGLGLYTDWKCSQDYERSDELIEDVLADYVNSEYYEAPEASGSGDYDDDATIADLSVSETIEKWNDAFDAFKVCQPCKAYNLGYNTNSNGNRQGGGNDEDDEDNGNGNYQPFTCYDDADYTNVNQCMKFKTKTEMLAADFRDIMLAHNQGNIVEMEVLGITYGKGGYRKQFSRTSGGSGGGTAPLSEALSTGAKAFLSVSWLVLLVGGWMLYSARQEEKASSRASSMERPLVTNEGVVA